MFTKTLLATSFAASALAAPSVLKARQNGPDACANTLDFNGETQCYVVDLGFYTDDSCTQPADPGYTCEYVGSGLYDPTRCDLKPAPGSYGCGDGNLPVIGPYYAMVKDGSDPALQVLFTADQSCPPSGPGAVLAVVENNKKCVLISKGGESPGVSIFPTGGSNLTKRGNFTVSIADEKHPLGKRDAKCKGFTTTSQQTSESASVQVSNVVDCSTSIDMDCTIEMGTQHEMSITTSYSATAGGGIEGIFEASATFGMEYTDSVTTEMQSTYVVPAGQKGYLTSYCAATEFTGTFTDCDDGMTHDGETLALKANGLTYLVTITGA